MPINHLLFLQTFDALWLHSGGLKDSESGLWDLFDIFEEFFICLVCLFLYLPKVFKTCVKPCVSETVLKKEQNIQVTHYLVIKQLIFSLTFQYSPKVVSVSIFFYLSTPRNRATCRTFSDDRRNCCFLSTKEIVKKEVKSYQGKTLKYWPR